MSALLALIPVLVAIAIGIGIGLLGGGNLGNLLQWRPAAGGGSRRDRSAGAGRRLQLVRGGALHPRARLGGRAGLRRLDEPSRRRHGGGCDRPGDEPRADVDQRRHPGVRRGAGVLRCRRTGPGGVGAAHRSPPSGRRRRPVTPAWSGGATADRVGHLLRRPGGAARGDPGDPGGPAPQTGACRRSRPTCPQPAGHAGHLPGSSGDLGAGPRRQPERRRGRARHTGQFGQRPPSSDAQRRRARSSTCWVPAWRASTTSTRWAT